MKERLNEVMSEGLKIFQNKNNRESL